MGFYSPVFLISSILGTILRASFYYRPPIMAYIYSRIFRRFRLIFLLSLAVSGLGAAKPDILLIMPDQYRGDTIAMLGHTAINTPTLDALAREGTLFRRAYASIPSCIPARYALLTGQEPQTSGVVGYAHKPVTETTLPEALASAGYATVLVGRNMHQEPISNDLGYQQRIHGSTYKADDTYDLELKQKLPGSGGIRGIVDTLELNNNLWPAKPWPYDEDLHPTNWIVRKSIDVLDEANDDQPIFITTSFYAPHPPLFPPERLFHKYLTSEYLPPVAMGAWVDRSSLSPEGNEMGERILLEGEKLRRAQAGYYGLIEQVDEQVGLLVEAFKARSERAGRPWVILFTSDHGEMLGDHGYFRKCEAYEGSANIPFVIAGSPEMQFVGAQLSYQPVGLEDVMPTLLDLAEVPAPETVDGRSLVAQLQGDPTKVRPWLHYEHSPFYSDEQGFHALTDGRWKYIWRTNSGTEQLFDLQSDPLEEADLSTVATHQDMLLDWRKRLVERLAGRPEGFSDGEKLISGREYLPIQKTPKGRS